MKNRVSVMLLLAIAGSASACSDLSSPTARTAPELISAPLMSAAAAMPIDGEYIVTLAYTESAPDAKALKLVTGHKGKLKRTFKHGLKGFSATLTEDAASAIAALPGVLRVESDNEMHASTTVSAASWGLDRIDQRALPLDGSYSYNSSGAGVRVYIVDTGVLTSHTEFGGRAVEGYTAIADGNGAIDCNGHGTHVAGTIGGATTGIARSAQLVAVRVLDCSGSGSSLGVIAGIDWVISQKTANPSVPMVANLSLGGGYNATLNDAVTRAVAAGVVFAVAAGNSSADACTQSPAAAPNALTVGASESNDGMAYYSNYGSCVDIFAPGSGIYSTWLGGGYATLSGTSMATPHVAGVAALILGDNPSYAPSQVRAAMVGGATSNVLSSLGSNSPNMLLNTSYVAAPAPPVAPVAPAPPPAAPPAPTVISLSVTKTKTGKNSNANLAWAGATATSVSVYRNGVLRTTTPNDGSYAESKMSSGTYTYKICQSTLCSPSVTVTF